MYHALNVTSGEVVCLQTVTLHIRQTGFVRLDHTIDDLCRRYLTDAHEEELNQTDMYSAYYGIDPQHERYIVQKDKYGDRNQNDQKKSNGFHK